MKSETETIKKCPKCKHYKKCFGHEKVFDYGCGYFELPVTNFDEITKSPETLAEFVVEAQIRGEIRRTFPWCYILGKESEVCPVNCRICLAEWLKQKAEDEE